MAALTCFVSCDVMEEPYIVGAEEAKEILEFKVDSIEGVIDNNQLTVTLEMPSGTDLSHLTPTIVVSTYATVSPESGAERDFTNPVVYRVTAYDGSTADYQVTATVHDVADGKSILSFRVEDPACEGIIDETMKTVTLYLPQGTNVAQIVPLIEVSEGATVSPASGEPQDFTLPVVYTVTAENGTTADYTVTAIVMDPSGKTVLLHDYTGVKCVNCPAAAEIAHQLQNQYDGRLVVMSVHAGYQATPFPDSPDFRTEEGDDWYNGNNSNPLGSVNRVKLLSGYTLQASAWTDAVTSAFTEPQTIEARVFNTYNETTRQLIANIAAMELEEVTGDLSVTVCLIEDNIVGKQVTPSGLATDYVHRHVFRTTLNGTYGEDLSFDDNHLYTKSFYLTLPETYNADNCYVVAYIYDKNQEMKILQTVVEKIK